jgi:hypothetical protein
MILTDSDSDSAMGVACRRLPAHDECIAVLSCGEKFDLNRTDFVIFLNGSYGAQGHGNSLSAASSPPGKIPRGTRPPSNCAYDPFALRPVMTGPAPIRIVLSRADVSIDHCQRAFVPLSTDPGGGRPVPLD